MTTTESSKQKELEEFITVCDELKKDILADLEQVHKLPREAIEWINEMIDYNCKGGKLNRGISVIHCAEAIAEGNNTPFTPEAHKKASILGWCIEWLQAFFLVADDVMDESITRRGQPCWYRIPKVKQIAINDSFLLESFVFQVLKKYFRKDSCYLELVELFKEVIYQTELGQLLDLTSQPMDGPVDLNRFTSERYRNIVVYKTAFYTFYLSAASAMLLSGITDESCYDTAKLICINIGEYFQVQDDYLDCYGSPEVIGKIGTDIQDNKCSWLVVQALQKATPEQRKILETKYGKPEEECIEAIKSVYKEMDLEAEYKAFEAQRHAEIMDLINKVDKMSKDVFLMLVNKIYKRSK